MISFQIFFIHLFIGGKSDEHEISSSPYASIGPPHENSEIKNRTESSSEVQAVGFAAKPAELSVAPPDPPPQIPSTDSMSMGNPENNVESMSTISNMAAMPITSTLPMPGVLPVQVHDAITQNQNNVQGNNNIPLINPSSLKGMTGIPMMFVKNGQMLIPIFGNQNSNGITNSDGKNNIATLNTAANPFTIAGNAAAQFTVNPGFAMPYLPSNVIPFSSSPSQPPTKPSSLQLPETLQPQLISPTTQSRPQLQLSSVQLQQIAEAIISQLRKSKIPINSFVNGNSYLRNKNTVASDSNNMYGDYLDGRISSMQPPDSSPIYQSSPLSETIASSRCEIPGSLCGSAGDGTFHQTENHSHKPKLDQQNMPSTTQLINAIMNAPGFPQLAARLMSEEPSFLSRDIGKQLTHERHLGEFPIDPNSNMESTDPASARFLMEQTVAKENPGDSFIRNDPNFPVLDNPWPDSNVETQNHIDQVNNENAVFNAKNVATNDISDPPGNTYNDMDESNTPMRFDIRQDRIRGDPSKRHGLQDSHSYQQDLYNLVKANKGHFRYHSEITSPVTDIPQNKVDPDHMSISNDMTERNVMNALSGKFLFNIFVMT